MFLSFLTGRGYDLDHRTIASQYVEYRICWMPPFLLHPITSARYHQDSGAVGISYINSPIKKSPSRAAFSSTRHCFYHLFGIGLSEFRLCSSTQNNTISAERWVVFMFIWMISEKVPPGICARYGPSYRSFRYPITFFCSCSLHGFHVRPLCRRLPGLMMFVQ